MKHFVAVVLIVLFSLPVLSQHYRFNYKGQEDKFEIRSEGDHIYCLFKISDKKISPTVYRKVFLDENLKATDSIEYSVEGVAELVATGNNEQYSYHLFYSKTKETDFFRFIITERDGRIHSTFTKTAVDFNAMIAKGTIKLKNIQLAFVDNYGSDGMLLLQMKAIYYGSLHTKMMSLDLETGATLWVSNAPYLNNIQTTPDRIIGLSSPNNMYVNEPGDVLFFINKSDGQVIKSTPFYSGRSNRVISVVTTNGKELLLAGIEYPGSNAKNGQFFLSMFDLNGQRIFDKLDTAARLSSKRMRLMGHVFDKDGNLVLIGEGWKIDVTRAIAATAGTIVAAAFIGGAAGLYTHPDNKIDKLIFASLSPDNGEIKSFKVFPIGPYNNEFGTLITDGEHVLFEFKNDIMIYDPNDNAPPKPFASLRSRESLLLATFGPVLIERMAGKKSMTLSLLHSNASR